MLSFRNLLFLAVAVNSSVNPRDVAQVRQDLEAINADVRAVTTAVNSYNDGIPNTRSILNARRKLISDIRIATDHTQAAGKVSEADADGIVGYVAGSFEPSIDAALSALEAKKETSGQTGWAAW
ncbi:hypothetical protein E4U41_006501 [Claviceps citrina]|nr:hypothetical protein E4U41_006501 [Claviceps citrina]